MSAGALETFLTGEDFCCCPPPSNRAHRNEQDRRCSVGTSESFRRKTRGNGVGQQSETELGRNTKLSTRRLFFTPSRRSQMFSLSKIQHDLRLPPHLLNRPLTDAIKEELEKLFLDKVIADLGLCVSVYDIQNVEGGFVYPGDGCCTYKVVFRLLMFRPFVGKILSAKIKASDATGLQLSLGFFDDIHAPLHLLQNQCIFQDDIWIWQYGDAELPMDLDEEVHFRVSSIKYPSIPVEQDASAKPFAPMEITAEVIGDGLGLVSWWE